MFRYFKIYGLLLKYSMMRAMQYRVSLFVELFVEFGYSFGRIFFIAVVYASVEGIAGWNYYEIMFFMALNIVSSEVLLGAVAINNLRELPEKIVRGEIDFVLLKPINSLFTLSLQVPYFSSFLSTLPAIYLMYYSYGKLDIDLKLENFAIGIYVFVIGNLIGYFILVIFASFSFLIQGATTLPRIGEILILSFKINPHDIYTGGWHVLFHWIVPVVFMASVPARFMLGGMNIDYVFYSTFLCLLFAIVTIMLWRVLVKNYTSAS